MQHFKFVLLNIFEGNLSTSIAQKPGAALRVNDRATVACFQEDDLLDTDNLKQIMFSVFPSLYTSASSSPPPVSTVLLTHY